MIRPSLAYFQVAVPAIGPSSHHCDEKVAHCHRIESDLVNASSAPKKVEPQKVLIFEPVSLMTLLKFRAQPTQKTPLD